MASLNKNSTQSLKRFCYSRCNKNKKKKVLVFLAVPAGNLYLGYRHGTTFRALYPSALCVLKNCSASCTLIIAHSYHLD